MRPDYLKKLFEYGVLFYFVAILAFLLFRSEITMLGSWIVTISEKKLVYLSIISLVIAATMNVVSASRWKRVFVLVALFSIPFLSFSDFFSLRGGKPFQSTDDIIVSLNNPYLLEAEGIRRLKVKSDSIEGLWEALCQAYVANCRVKEGRDVSELATRAMLIVSSFFDYGNLNRSNLSKAGCIYYSEETNFNRLAYNFETFQQSQIGCCTDYAYALASFLNYLDIENELVHFPGHMANRVKVTDEWVYLDANTNLYVGGLFDANTKAIEIHYYPHSNIGQGSQRYNIYNFQKQLISSFADRSHYIFNYLEHSSSSLVNDFYK